MNGKNQNQKKDENSTMLTSDHTIRFDTFVYKAATGNTGSRVDNSGRGNTNDNEPRTPKFLMIAKRTNRICLCMNRFGMFSSPTRLDTVLSNRKNLATMKDHGDMIVCTMFGSVAGKLAKDVRLNIPLYVGRKHHVWMIVRRVSTVVECPICFNFLPLLSQRSLLSQSSQRVVRHGVQTSHSPHRPCGSVQ